MRIFTVSQIMQKQKGCSLLIQYMFCAKKGVIDSRLNTVLPLPGLECVAKKLTNRRSWDKISPFIKTQENEDQEKGKAYGKLLQ